VEPTQLGQIDRVGPYLQSPKRRVFKIKARQNGYCPEKQYYIVSHLEKITLLEGVSE
jgi:hypothetical protein